MFLLAEATVLSLASHPRQPETRFARRVQALRQIALNWSEEEHFAWRRPMPPNHRPTNILSAMRVFSLILLPLVLSGGVADHPEVLGQERLIESWIRGQMTSRHLPGIVVGVVFDQELIWAKGFGFA